MGTRADLIELGVAHQAACRIIIDIAVAAEALQCFERDAGGLLGGEQDRCSGVVAPATPRVAGARDRIDERTGGGELGLHIGDLRLHQLEAADRRAELVSLVQVGQGEIERCGHDAERPAGQDGTLVI